MENKTEALVESLHNIIQQLRVVDDPDTKHALCDVADDMYQDFLDEED